MSAGKPVKTIIFAGGGTGGHLFPGIALADEFRRRDPEMRIVFAGTRRGLEARVLPELGYPLVFLEVKGLVGISGRRRLQALATFPKAVIQALILLVRYRPDLVVGLGGYASAPVLLAAMVAGIPWVLQEQNAFPGLVNRLLAPFAAAVFTAFAEARTRLKSRRVYDYGNPLRDLASAPQPQAGAAEKGFQLLVVGGSQGAAVFNRVLPEAFKMLADDHPGLSLLLQTGIRQHDEVATALQGYGDRVEIKEFITDMAAAYARADLVIARAGALTLAELCLLGKAALLVPFPYAAHDHQSFNAEVLAAAGAAWLRPEAEFSAAALARDLTKLMAEPQTVRSMEQAALGLGCPAARKNIVDHCLQLIETQ